jgi:hypothetical protein
MVLLEVAFVYAGLAGLAIGLASLARPLAFLGVRTRSVAARVMIASAASLLVGFGLPAGDLDAPDPATRLDAILPVYQFAELHQIDVAASPSRVFAAIKAVTASEIRFFRLLTWIRAPSWPWMERPEGILAAPPDKPILDVALAGGFLLLDEEPEREIVFGTLVCCGPPLVRDAAELIALDRPGHAKAFMNFTVRPEGTTSRVTTATRVFATDPHARRRFATYWRLIYPGSALIRRSWLQAIKRRAEGDST